jgi:uncharacterized protein (TIGR00730 family)
MKSVCVFCGSSAGESPCYAESARRLGRLLARRGLELVYGGGSVGLMGVLADAALGAGGRVLGVIPDRLAKREIMHLGLTELRIVRSMHERKAVMAEASDAFVALPGAFGTMDELFEILTWGQLGEHEKPIGLVNVAGYFDPLLDFLQRMTAERFLKPKHRDLLLVDEDECALLDRLSVHRPPALPKWIDSTST